MSLDSLRIETLYLGTPSLSACDMQPAVTEALDAALKRYVEIHDVDRSRDNPIITRNVGAFAVLDSTKGGGWSDRIQSISLFASGELNADETMGLMVAKALHRAHDAELQPMQPFPEPLDTPAYYGLGRAGRLFASGFAGPYPFHSRLVHDQFFFSLSQRLMGGEPRQRDLSSQEIVLIRSGEKGGVDGDSGDNTPEMEASRQEFQEYADALVATL